MAAYDKLIFSFNGAGEPNNLFPIIFDPNVDLDNHIFLCVQAVVVFAVSSVGSYMISLGALAADTIETTGFIGAGVIPAAANGRCLSNVVSLTQVDDYYYAQGYSGVRIDVDSGVSGTLVLLGKYRAMDDEIMAQVTFDYSALISP
jgi:hypothetical protein